MTDSPTTPEAPPTTPKAPVSLRRRILVITIGLVAATAAYIGVQAAIGAVASLASNSAPAVEETKAPEAIDEAEGGELYTDEAGGYSIGTDGEPLVEQIDETTTSATGKLGTADYQVFVVNSPEALTGDTATVRENILTGFVATTGVTVRASTVDTLGGEEALLAITDLDSGGTLHIAIAIHNDLIYAVIVPELDSDDDDAVFESFVFTS